MNETAVEIGTEITVEQKQAALDAVLHSQTFARADQLKSFLKFVCEMEISGRGAELSEYLIGVEALGRSPNYSPGDDSAVRNRAFALRKKLLEFYEHEDPHAELRIELTKGSYCPHFVPCHLSALPKAAEPEAVEVALTAPLAPLHVTPEIVPPKVGRRRQLPAFLAGVIVTALCAGVIFFLSRTKPVSSVAHAVVAPIVAEAWGPILTANADVLLCVGNPPSFSVHTSATPVLVDAASKFNAGVGRRPLPAELQEWFQRRYPNRTEPNFFVTLTPNATYWGDALAAMLALKTMFAAGASSQMFPEKIITVPTLRRRNVVLFGAPEYSVAVEHFLEKCPLTVNYMSSIISQGSGQAATPLYTVKSDQKNQQVQTYGLITVLPSNSTTNHQHRTIIFSGINSAGTQAAAEFFTSPDNLLLLKRQLEKDGHRTFPPAYQVVVSSEIVDNILVNFKYETYRVIPALADE
jgi:hypothetical protein